MENHPQPDFRIGAFALHDSRCWEKLKKKSCIGWQRSKLGALFQPTGACCSPMRGAGVRGPRHKFDKLQSFDCHWTSKRDQTLNSWKSI